MQPSLKDKFEMTADRFFHRDYRNDWFACARTARRESPEALQGFHSENLLFCIEEASGVCNEVFEVAEGSLTSAENYVLLIGNPTRINGYFFNAFHSDRNRWKTLHFKSTDSPLVNPSYAQRMAERYGKHSNIYRVRVNGDFPTAEDDQLIPLHLLEDAVVREVSESEPIVWGLDVARYGSDETVLCKRHGNVIVKFKGVRNYDLMQTAGWVAAQYNEAEQKPKKIMIDVIGIGSGVFDRLREQGYPVSAVNVAESAREKGKYMNLRSELYHRLKDFFVEGRSKIPNDSELIGQTSSIKYHFDSSGRIAIEKKEDLKKRGLPSPDRADAAALTFKDLQGVEDIEIYSVDSPYAGGYRDGWYE